MKRLNNNEFIEKCIKKHGNLYDYSLCVYENTRSKVKIICNNHGEFELQASNHLHQNQGCVECVREKHKFIKMSNYQIESLKKIHDNKYQYEKEVKNGRISIKCDKHDWFEQSYWQHTYGNGCPKCKSSKGEKKIRNYLKSIGEKFEEGYMFDDCRLDKKLKFDFYLLNKNICIEYDGKQHFESVEYFGGEKDFAKRKKRDIIKNEYCSNNNIKLIRIPYFKFDDINFILNNEIL